MTDALNATPQQKSEILMQALPHMLRYDDAIVVVKYGGHAMGDEAKARDFAKDMVLLEQSGINPVVVHGGGPQIGSMLKKLGIESRFPAASGSPTSRPSKSSKWCWRARSTSRSSARSTPRAAARSACAARTATWWSPARSHRPHAARTRTSSISASSASRTRST